MSSPLSFLSRRNLSLRAEPAAGPLDMTKRNIFGAAQGAVATAPPQRMLGHNTNQGRGPLLLHQVLEVRDPLWIIPFQKASPTIKQWLPWGREADIVFKAMEDTIERTEGGQGTVWCPYCKLSPQSSVRQPHLTLMFIRAVWGHCPASVLPGFGSPRL